MTKSNQVKNETITTAKATWLSSPEPCSPKTFSLLRVANDEHMLRRVCVYAGLEAAAIVAAFEAAPAANRAAALKNNGFSLDSVFNTPSSGQVEIWGCSNSLDLDLTIAETFVSLQETRDGGKIFFHIDCEEALQFPGWMAKDWLQRGVNAAMAIALALANDKCAEAA